jgi:hypothetical protein
MLATPVCVEPGSFLTLHYRLAGPAGDVINTFGGKPATLTLGSGELSPAVETCLMGLAEGARATFALPAGAAFGDRNPAMLQWLALDRLVIDDAYQRPLLPGTWKSIEKIAANFQWSRFSPVLVAPIAGGLFAVIDGQHRVHAAARGAGGYPTQRPHIVNDVHAQVQDGLHDRRFVGIDGYRHAQA